MEVLLRMGGRRPESDQAGDAGICWEVMQCGAHHLAAAWFPGAAMHEFVRRSNMGTRGTPLIGVIATCQRVVPPALALPTVGYLGCFISGVDTPVAP